MSETYDFTEKLKDAHERVARMTPEERDHYAAYGYVYWNLIQEGGDDEGFRQLVRAASQQ